MSFKKATDALLKNTTKVFGSTVQYTHKPTNVVATIKAIFDHAFVDVNGVASRRPVLRVVLADLALVPKEGDLASVDSLNFRVAEPYQPDTHGEAVLILERI